MTDMSSLHRKAQQAIGSAIDVSETVLIAQPGESAALVATDRRVLIFKWGVQSGLMFGSQLNSWDLSQITGVEFRTGITTKSIVVQTAGAQAITKFGRLDSGNESVWEAPNALFVSGGNEERTVGTLRQMAADRQQVRSTSMSVPSDDSAEQIRKFAGLRDEGIISDEEFQAKKRSILGISSPGQRSEPELDRLGIDSAEYFESDRRSSGGADQSARLIDSDASRSPRLQSGREGPQGPTVVHQIDINSASVEQVAALPGLNEREAQSIVAARERAGGFTNMERLIEITDLKPHQIVAIRDHLSFGSHSVRDLPRGNHGRILDI